MKRKREQKTLYTNKALQSRKKEIKHHHFNKVKHKKNGHKKTKYILHHPSSHIYQPPPLADVYFLLK